MTTDPLAEVRRLLGDLPTIWVCKMTGGTATGSEATCSIGYREVKVAELLAAAERAVARAKLEAYQDAERQFYKGGWDFSAICAELEREAGAITRAVPQR